MFYSTYRNECQGPRAEKTLPSERDGDEDGGEEDDEDSDNDLQIVLEQSGTADSTGAASGGTEAPAKKAKITLTEEEENFAKQFRPAASKIDKERKITLRHVSGRGSSIKKQGTRKHDVKPQTMKQSLMDFSNQFLQVLGGQLYCGTCCTNVGSCKSDERQHCNTMQHQPASCLGKQDLGVGHR